MIIEIPLNAGGLSKRQGVEKGPAAVAAHLKDFYMKESGMLPLYEIKVLEVDNSNLERAHSQIEQQVSALKGFNVLIGGDHSMTYPAFKAFAAKNKGAGIIVLDAHPDLQDDQNPPTHEDWLRALIEQGHLEKGKVALFGMRNMSIEEHKYIEKNKIMTYSAREIAFEGLKETIEAVMSVARQWPALYVSVDIDVLDSAFAPGTGYSEPGGLTTRELIYVLQRLKMLRNLSMADVVEVNPDLDVAGATAKAAAKITLEFS